jgi:hypothetical protein
MCTGDHQREFRNPRGRGRFLAEGRNSGSVYELLLWRKQTPGIRFSEAGNYPTETLRFKNSRAASCPKESFK